MTRQYPQRPVFGVGAAIIRDDEVVLIKRGREPKRGEWSLPGGAQKLGESAEAAVVREVLEETGLKVAPLALIELLDIIDKDEAGKVRHHYTVADYFCLIKGGKLKAGGDATEARFVNLKDLPDYKLTKAAWRVIEKAWKDSKST